VRRAAAGEERGVQDIDMDMDMDRDYPGGLPLPIPRRRRQIRRSATKLRQTAVTSSRDKSKTLQLTTTAKCHRV